jgi:alpha-L-fucosidase
VDTNTYSVSTHTHGNITNAGALQSSDITIANGDKLVVTDASSSSKVARTSVAFDGSTTTQALTKKGTFETFLQSHQDISGKEDTSNKVSSWSSTTTNEHYPSEKLVKDSLDLKAPLASPALTGTPTAPTASAGTNTTQVATTAFVKAAVDTAIADVADALIYKGTIAGGSTGNYGALTAAANKGDLYKVSAAGKVNGVSVEVGDMLICNSDSTAAATSSNYTTIAAKWDVIQTNIEGYVLGPSSSVNNRVAVFDGTTGKTIKDSGYTIATSVPSGAVFTDTKVTSSANHYTPSTVSGNDKSASASGATAAWGIDVVKGVTLNTDGKGHVTGISVTSGKIPSNPDTNTTLSGVAFCNTAAGTAAKTATMPGFALSNGQRIILHLATASTVASATLNVNSTGEKSVLIDGAATTASNFTAGYWLCNYDGTYWQAEKVDFTDTKVTSSANHYTPATASGNDKSASASGATAAWNIDVVKGVTLNTDGKGHVTGISVTSGKIPGNPNTDTKVKATAKTDNANYKILATASASPTSGNATEAVYDTDITLNPSTNTIAANISGDAATASAAKSGSTLATTIAGKQDALTTQTAYTSKGSATKVPQITTNSLGQVTGITEVTISGVTPAAHNHSQITTAGDNRSVATAPNDYSNKLIFQGLKTNSVIGSPASDTYSFVVGLRGWSDSSGGNAHELAFNNTGLFIRRGATTAWGNWEKVLTSANIPTATSSVAGITTVGASDGAAAYDHTHDNYITDIYYNGATIASISNGIADISNYVGSSGGLAEYGHAHGNITNEGGITASGVTIANGDSLVIVDSSDTNKLMAKTTITFDGSTTSKYLSQKGTWVSIPTDTNTTLSGVAYCDTAGATKAKAATMPGFALSSGQRIVLHLATASTVASATLNVNSTGAKTVKIGGANTTATNFIAGYWVCNYDGTNWVCSRLNADVKQGATTTANYRKILLSGPSYGSAAAAVTDSTDSTYQAQYVEVKPSTGELRAKSFVKASPTNATGILLADGTDIAQSTFATAGHSHSGYKTTQTAVSDPTASSTTSNTFIDSISQDTNGVITVTKKTVPVTTDTNTTLSGIAYCNTGASTAAKAATMPGFALSSGQRIILHLVTASTVANATLNVNSTAAKTIKIDGANTTASNFTAGYWLCNYDGSYWQATKIYLSDTDTKVTSSANHYTPATASGNDKSASASGATAAWSIDVVKGVTLNTDGKGHVTGISVTSGKIPSNPNTDTNVTQTYAAASGYTNWRPLVVGKSNGSTEGFTPSTTTDTTFVFDTISCQPSSGTIRAGKFKVIGGTSSQFLKADGSTDSNSYIHDIQHDGASVVTVTNGVAAISGFKTTQTAVSDPTASGTSTSFISTLSQDTNGVVSVTKASLPTASSSVAGITKVGASGGAAAYNHSHSGYKTTQTAVSDPTASSTTSTTFIDSISQDTNGVITVTKKTVPVTTDTNTTLSGVAYCDTAGATKAKAATMPGFALSSGQRIILHLVNDSTVAAATLSVNSTAAKNVRIGGANTTASNFTAGYWLCNYDGSYWQATKIYLTDTTYPTATSSVAGITTVGASGGAAAYSHTHSYLPLSGGTMTGNITMSSGKGVIFTNYTTSSSFSDSDRTVPFSANGSNNISLTSTDSTKGLTFNPATGALKTGSFVKLGGTSSQFLKADGSTDSNSYISGIYYDGTSIATVSNGIADISGAVGVSGGLAAYSHGHSEYVAKTGDTMTGDLTISESGPAIIFRGATSGKQEYRMLQSDGNDAFKLQNRDNGSSSSYTDMMLVKKNYFYLPKLFVAGTETTSETTHVLDTYAPNMTGNRLFGLPASCIIVEISHDSGATWQDGGFTDTQKRELFTTDMAVGLQFPKKNGAYSTDTRMRITFTNTKYNVPDGTPETQKYSYWNNNYYNYTLFRGPFIGFRIMYYAAGPGNIQVYTSNMFSPDTWTEVGSATGVYTSSEKTYICPTVSKYMYTNVNSPSYAHNIRMVFTPTTVNATYAHAVRMIEMYAKFINSASGNARSMMMYGVPYEVDMDGNMSFYNATTTTQKLIFKRSNSGSYWNWAMYGKSNGSFELAYCPANSSTWTPALTTLNDTAGINVPKLKITGGTSSQFLKADGTLDSNVYVKRPSAGNGTSGQVLSTNGDGTTSWVSQSGGGSSGYDHGSTVIQNGPNQITVELGTTCDSQCAFDVFQLDSNSDVNMDISIPSGAYKGCHTFIFVNSDTQSNPAHIVTIQPRPLTAPAITMINPVTLFNVYPIGTQQGCHYAVVKIYYDTMPFPDMYSQGVINEIDVVRIEILNHSDLDMALNS